MKRLRIYVCLAVFCLAGTPAAVRGQGSLDEFWPQWRGPQGDGMAVGDAPTRWSDSENIRWKIAIPGRGHSTPVIWGNRIFLTTAIQSGPVPEAPAAQAGGRRGGFAGGDASPQAEHRFEVLCLDRSTGEVIWQRTARVATPHEGYHRTYGSFASNAPVTDGKHLYAFFGSRGIFCYDLDGNLVWERDFGVQMKIHLQFGEGITPALHEETLLLNYDHQGDSFIVALDKRTGDTRWRTARDEVSSWSGPLVLEHAGRKQVVVSATNKVRSYDFQTGALVWECAGLGTNPIPMPVTQGDLVYVMSGHRSPNLMAIRLGRQGDLTGTDAVAWSITRGVSYTPSPVLHDGKLYLLTDSGLLSCLDAATGEPYYQQVRLPKPYSFKASPVGAGGKLYLATENGDVVIVRMGTTYEAIATNTLEEQVFIASPVVVGGVIYLRSQTHLFCISDQPTTGNNSE